MVRFRQPKVDDAGSLTALAHASKRLWNYPDDWIALWETSLTITAERLQNWHCEVAECGGTVLGFYAVSVREGVAELEHLWVSPGCVGMGFGKRLFQRAQLYCRNMGIPRLRVVSDPNAEGFYRRMGGVAVGKTASVPAPRMLPVLEFDVSGSGGTK